MDKVYPNTRDGVRDYLKDESKINLDGASYQADPEVEGVWKVTLATPDTDDEVEDAFVLVYLAGYKDAWGRVRERNDFEECW